MSRFLKLNSIGYERLIRTTDGTEQLTFTKNYAHSLSIIHNQSRIGETRLTKVRRKAVMILVVANKALLANEDFQTYDTLSDTCFQTLEE